MLNVHKYVCFWVMYCEPPHSGQSYPVIQDENSLRLILELMSLSNTPGDTRDQVGSH